jgi:hypothetical protein
VTRFLKIAGFGLAAMLVACAALAGSAAALPLWLVCLETGTEGAPPTKYTSNQCTKAAEGNRGRWQSLGLRAGVNDTIRLLGLSIRFVDTGMFGGMPLELKCNLGFKASGAILRPDKLLITLWSIENTAINCERLSNELCKKVVEIKGVDLPWESEMREEGGKILNFTRKGEGAIGEPGFAITCETFLGNKTDECTTPKGKEEGEELISGITGGILLVLSRFEEKSKYNCTEGGTEKGIIGGLLIVLLSNGSGLSVNKT